MKDQLREESNQTFGDQILDIGEKAVAAGIVAAAFYRNGGRKFLSNNLNRYAKKGREIYKTITKYDYEHLNSNTIFRKDDSIYNEIKGIIKKSNNDEKVPEKVQLMSREGTGLGVIEELMRIQDRQDYSAKDIFIRTRIHQRLLDEFTDNFLKNKAGLKDYEIGQFKRGFLEKLLQNISTINGESLVNNLYRIYKTNKTQSDALTGIMNKALKFAIELKESAEKDWEVAKKNGKPLTHQPIKNAVIDKTIEQLLNQYSKSSKTKKVINGLLDDRAITIGDILDEQNKDKFESYFLPGNKNGQRSFEELQKTLQEIAEKLEKKDKKLHEQFLNVEADPLIRIDKSKNIFSFSAVAGAKRKILNAAARTVPGKILKLPDIEMSGLAPSISRISMNTVMPSLASFERAIARKNAKMPEDLEEINEKYDGIHTRNDYWVILGKLYRHDDDHLEHIKEFSNVSLVSSRYGGINNLYSAIAGFNSERNRGYLSKLFDVNGSTNNNFIENLYNTVKGNPDLKYELNIIQNVRNGIIGDTIYERYDNLVKINEFLEKNIRGFDNSMLENIRDTINNLQTSNPEKYNEVKDIFDFLLKGDFSPNKIEEINATITSKDDNSKQYLNLRLNKLVSDFFNDSRKALNKVTLEDDISGAFYSGAKEGANFAETFQKELSKELILRIARTEMPNKSGEITSYYDFNIIKEFLENSKMNLQDLSHAKELAYATMSEHNFNGTFTNEIKRNLLSDKTIFDNNIIDNIELYEDFLSNKTTDKGRLEASNVLFNLVKRNSRPNFLRSSNALRPDDIPAQYVSNDYYVLPETEGPLKIIGAINQYIKDKNASIEPIKDSVMRLARQLLGGRGDMENVSIGTMIPYFFLHRLGADDLPSFLQFSNQSTSSTWQLAKTIGKRLLPLAVGSTYLEWMDDTVGAITGIKASAGFINGLDYMDIGFREILDKTAFAGMIDTQTRINPILQYWFGRDGYYDADKERDYYANGVEAVRSGRYWAFGSVNEFRGSAIQYYRPNLTRRLNSNYYDKSLYDGYFDKWSHSLLPTPIAPFSPLAYVLDPYYLENKHYNDRPYLLTAPMFSEGTPWGAVLNPTIGELIKPVKRMHEDRMYGGSDALAIISSINKHIRDTADNNHAYAMVFERDQITAGEYTEYASPSLGEDHIKLNQDEHDLRIAKQEAVLGNTLETSKRNLLYEYGSGGGSGGSGSFSVGVSGEYDSDRSGSPLDMLGQTNRRIKAIAAQTNRGGIITPDKIHYHKIDSLLNDSENIEDLLQSGQGHELLTQMASSMRLIAGIYGYGAHRYFGFGDSHETQIANAGDINSFSRSFWDLGIGGIGGGAAEIGRRFIPEFRRNIRRNPLLNTMPDWLPEEFRVGDPYTIPYGEARLPGKGYEALNKLHPDEFGDMYGSFDRYKILADVAPNSTEFKVWKQIAQKTVKDPQLRKEMAKIQDRVNEANKQHDFYDYQILGQDVEYKEAIIREVYKDGTFRIMGSDEIFKLAGVETVANAESRTEDRFQTAEEQVSTLNAMREYLTPGHSVTIALDSNIYHRRNSDSYGTISAAVYANGENVSQALLENHSDVFLRKEKNITPIDVYAMASPTQRFVAGVGELISHMDLPLVHDRWLRVRSPMESYNAEQIYGTPYQTWSELLGTFLFPALERSVSDPVDTFKSTAEFLIMANLKNKAGTFIANPSMSFLENQSAFFKKYKLSIGMSLFDRGAFIGGAIGHILNADSGKYFERGQKIGAAFQMLGTLYTSTQTNNMLTPILPWAEAGFIVGDVLDETKENFIKTENTWEKFYRNSDSLKGRLKYAAAGAALGIAIHGMIGPGAFSDADRWIPERVKKKWELEDYFDRLTYVKYMGLYNQAAAKAKSEEGIDIERIFEDQEKYEEKRQEIIENSDVNNTSLWQTIRRTVFRNINKIKYDIAPPKEQSHRFEYANGFSINDLPGVRDGVFYSNEISEEERLYTLNALVTMGIKYGVPGSTRTNEDRDISALTEFEKVYDIKIPDYYQVHHIVQFSKNGPDDPSNLIALSPDDHLYITEAHERFWSGDFSAAQIGAKTAVRLGEYGRSALLYKKVAESTMYGLKENAKWTDIVKSLPKYERDYFTEFMKEKDPDKQQEILMQVSPFLRRALKQVWGMNYEEDKGPSNEEYFQNHNLPNFYWEGWDPDSDLNKIKAKTIKNEGMMFSDFGIYESTYRDPEVINAPNLSPQGTQDPISLQANLAATLSGLGLKNVEVSVEPKSTKGIQSIVNIAKVIDFKFKETVNEMFA